MSNAEIIIHFFYASQRHSKYFIITARKRSLRRLCFYRCLSVHGGKGVCMVAPGGVGACVVRAWGVCMVALGGHAWLPRGACMVAPRGHAWLLWGGSMVARGGMHGCSGGHAWLLQGGVWLLPGGGMHGCSGGVCGFFDEIRSMSGRYASYWNAFLFVETFYKLAIMMHWQISKPQYTTNTFKNI